MFELSLILIHALSAEAPSIENDIRYENYKIGYNMLLQTDQKIINEEEDYLVNPEVDLNILATIQLFESRLRPNTKDGDCIRHYKKIGGENIIKFDCRSVGNMQISRGAVKWAQNIDHEKFKNLTVEDLRTPETNTRVGYYILKQFKTSCKSSLPGVWITAYGEGKCPKNNQLDMEGLRRCAVLTEELKTQSIMPINWKCGHEGKNMKDPTALKFIAKMEELNKLDSKVETAKN